MSKLCFGETYEPWLRRALSTPPWSSEQVERARSLAGSRVHLGEVAEALACSVFEIQAELGIGPAREVKAYRRLRGLDKD